MSSNNSFLTRLILIDLYLIKRNKPDIFEFYDERENFPKVLDLICSVWAPRQVDRLSLTNAQLTIDDHDFIHFIKENEDEVYDLLKLNEDQFKNLIQLRNQNGSIAQFPKEINEFIVELFDFSNDRMSLLQLYSKNSNFLPTAIENNAAITYYCFETSKHYFSKTLINTIPLNKNIHLNHTNDVTLLPYFQSSSDATFGMIYANFVSDFPKIPQAGSTLNKDDHPSELTAGPIISLAQLIYLVEKRLALNGKAVLVLPQRFFTSSLYRDTREYLVKNNLVEFVIKLPSYNKAHSATVNILVLRHSSTTIEFLDASKYIKSETRSTIIFDVYKTLHALYSREASESMAIVPTSDIDEEYILEPLHYLSRVFPNECQSVVLGDICEVFTGWQASKETLDKTHLNQDTKEIKATQIVQMSDVDNYMIMDSNNRFYVDDKRYQRFAIYANDLVLTNKTFKIKTAVKDDANSRMIASGGIMVIRPKIDLINPFYLQAFLESDLGQKQLNSVETGDIGKGLTVNRAKKMMIPLIDRNRQDQIAEEYKRNNKMIAFYIRQIEKRTKKNLTIFKESMK